MVKGEKGEKEIKDGKKILYYILYRENGMII